ncbi:MAG: VWA domain-containing protein [Nitrososphaerota archaeon]|nr:VWA domain-containing protein [Candidatus Calditenuaceae archaeon]MDW8073355.1 VWA domain-containing protein [Nitrososphaerota archaeon]
MHLYEFVCGIARSFRRRGLKVGISESIDACQAIGLIADRGLEDIITAIRVTMIKDPSKYHLIEQAIEEAVAGGGSGAGEESGGEEGAEGSDFQTQSMRSTRGAGQDRDSTSTQYVMYSPAESLHKRNLRPVDTSALKTGRRIIKRMRRRLAVLPGRRSHFSKRGEIEFAKTIRYSFKTFGEIMELRKSAKILSRARLVALIDISGSMDTYTDWLVRAMYLFKRFTRRVEVFVFSTRQRRITELLSVTDLEEVRRRLSNEIDLWGSGTRIGYSLKSFIDNYGNMLNRSWIVVIVSDGWDTGEPELLRMSMISLKQRVGRIIWLNPHTDRPNFKPLTIGMLTALPHIDVLAGLSVLENYTSFLAFFGKSIKPLRRGESLVRHKPERAAI